MTTIDQPTDPRHPTIEDRLDAARAKWEHLEDERLSALTDYLALLAGKPAPSDGAHVERFATDVKAGDHVQWEGAWWYVTDILRCVPWQGGPDPDAFIALSRVGREPLELRLAGNTLLTVVRPVA